MRESLHERGSLWMASLQASCKNIGCFCRWPPEAGISLGARPWQSEMHDQRVLIVLDPAVRTSRFGLFEWRDTQKAAN